jgi:hypothetical protein
MSCVYIYAWLIINRTTDGGLSPRSVWHCKHIISVYYSNEVCWKLIWTWSEGVIPFGSLTISYICFSRNVPIFLSVLEMFLINAFGLTVFSFCWMPANTGKLSFHFFGRILLPFKIVISNEIDRIHLCKHVYNVI